MFRNLCSFVCLSALISIPLAGTASADLATDISNSVTGTSSDGTTSIPYRLFEPQGVAAGTKVPLILYLHGAGERGTDNVAQTQWIGNLTDKTASGQYAAYVLAPQINTNMWFASSGAQSEAETLTLSALQQAMSNPNVDTSRIYIMGASMGSFGTWDLLRRYPSLFAAAVPMSGGGDPSTAAAVKNIPIWAFHGSDDDVVGVQTTRDMIQAIKDAGGDPNYTEIAGGGHEIWPQVLADSGNTLYPWLFGQSLDGATVPDFSTNSSDAMAPAAVLSPAVVPEPASLSVLGLGVAFLMKRRRRQIVT